MTTIDPISAEEELKSKANKVSEKDVETLLEKRKEIEAKFTANSPLGKFIGDVKILFSMVQDYWRGDYREVPWWVIAAVVAALLYVLSPVDLVPDFIPVVGLLDDAAVVAACLTMIKIDLNKYREWKKLAA